MKSVCVVIPAKNESETIENVVKEAFFRCSKHKTKVVVVNDSSDDTGKLALQAGAILVPGDGKGLGSAMLKGLKSAAKLNPDAILALDSDGQADLSEIDNFLGPVLSGEADLVIGSRFRAKNLVQYDYPFLNRLGVAVLALYLSIATGKKFTDSHGGIRAMSAEVARRLELIGSHTYVQESVVDAHEKGFRIIEISSKWLRRKKGESRVVASIPKYVAKTLPALLIRLSRLVLKKANF